MAMLAAATQGDVALIGANLRHFGIVRAKLEQMGVQLEEDGPVVRVRRHGPLRPVNIITWPYPGYPTDLQSPLIALACLAEGTSYIRETLFDQRFGVADELNKMGAHVTLEDGSAVIAGPSQLIGATVWAHDLRAGSALVIAAAAAEGETIIDNAQMIERGYSSIIRRLSRLGLHIEEERLEAVTP
jgi:UDP-N-acetylglucosamine 1-carboxyvinyltransferase